MVVKAIGDWKTNAAMIAELATLGYLEGKVLDLTYGKGRFWTDFRPELLVTNDIASEHPTHHQADFTNKFVCINTFGTWYDTIVFDPPYAYKGTPSGTAIDTDYGVNRYRTADEVDALRYAGVETAALLCKPGGYVLVKCQDQIVSGKPRWQTYDTVEFTKANTTLTLLEDLKFMSYRPQPAGRSQKHVRRNYSSLLVFKKGVCREVNLDSGPVSC